MDAVVGEVMIVYLFGALFALGLVDDKEKWYRVLFAVILWPMFLGLIVKEFVGVEAK